MEDENGERKGVSVSMEISGEYDEVLSRLDAGKAGRSDLGPFVDDVDLLLEAVVETGGGTRSALAERLPAETTVSFDAEAVVDLLRVLERYDLVVLDGNTWKPGPNLRS
ncbi:MAG: hypothetical protein ABEJ82_01280 [Haloplanus sp.]